MGGLHGWRVYPLPASGHLSNVSHVVLPVRAGMADHEQVAMFPEDDSNLDPREKLLFHVVRMQAETVRMQAAAIAALQRANGQQHQAEHHPYGPANPKHRTWRGFVLDLQDIETRIKPPNRVTRKAVADKAGETDRTLRRSMQGYGLRPDQWPPSTWNPDEDRVWHSPN
jgi:hypothetical protein